MCRRHDPLPATRGTTPRRWLGRCSAIGLLVATGLLVSACGSSGSSTGSSRTSASSLVSFAVLNTQKIERAIALSSLAQRGKHVRVSCPSGMQQKAGLVFYCTAFYGRSTTPFMVTELDGSGDVHYVAR